MSGGTVNISRAIWDDPTFRDAEMTQREAWIWLVAEASWKERTKRVGSSEITLCRGQLAASYRFLAKAWMWSESRVRRYFDMLENRRMVTRVTDAGVTVITICNYDKYQDAQRVGDAGPTQRPTQDRRAGDANEKKGERKKEEDLLPASSSCDFPRETPTQPPRDDPPPSSPDLRQRVMAACGTREHPMPARWMPPVADLHVRRWVTDLGLTEDEVLAVAKGERMRHAGHDPPSGPKALDRAMQAFAAEKSAPPMIPAPQRTTNGQSPHARADAALDEARRALDAGTIHSLVAGPYAPGASRRR